MLLKCHQGGLLAYQLMSSLLLLLVAYLMYIFYAQYFCSFCFECNGRSFTCSKVFLYSHIAIFNNRVLPPPWSLPWTHMDFMRTSSPHRRGVALQSQ